MKHEEKTIILNHGSCIMDHESRIVPVLSIEDLTHATSVEKLTKRTF
jgi:hypothetical protein